MFNMRSPWFPSSNFGSTAHPHPARTPLLQKAQPPACLPTAPGTTADCLSMLERIYDAQLKSTLRVATLAHLPPLASSSRCRWSSLIGVEWSFLPLPASQGWKVATCSRWLSGNSSEAACHMASVIFYCLTVCCLWVCLGVCLGGLWQGGGAVY